MMDVFHQKQGKDMDPGNSSMLKGGEGNSWRKVPEKKHFLAFRHNKLARKS